MPYSIVCSARVSTVSVGFCSLTEPQIFWKFLLQTVCIHLVWVRKIILANEPIFHRARRSAYKSSTEPYFGRNSQQSLFVCHFNVHIKHGARRRALCPRLGDHHVSSPAVLIAHDALLMPWTQEPGSIAFVHDGVVPAHPVLVFAVAPAVARRARGSGRGDRAGGCACWRA